MVQITVARIDQVAGYPNPIMVAFGKQIPFDCFVRNELNGLRQMNEVVYSENADGSQGVPYMPRPFPVGTWQLFYPHSETDALTAPYFFPTDAWQIVDEWDVAHDINGKLCYVGKTGRQVKDYGYGLHCSSAHESDGCLHIIDDPLGVKGKFDYIDELFNDMVAYLKDPSVSQPPELRVDAV